MQNLPDLFRARYGAAGGPRVVRAPGRVNLIGDHTDYNGLPVFPMAVEREIRIAFRARSDSRVTLASAASFPERDFELSPSIPPYPPGDWGNYAKASAQALVQTCGELRGMDALVWGDIPEAAGMSSSSALVVASAVALLESNELPWDRGALAQLMAAAERYVGTQGGGMDQTVCLCAQAGAALRIDFTPFGYTPVPMPPDWVFLVGNSLVAADKSLGARERYNSTHGRCSEALRMLDMGDTYPEVIARVSLPGLLAEAARRLPPALLQAFRHVVTESARVDAAEAAMRAGRMEAFGALMDASHQSLRDDLGVSVPPLDELVQSFRDAGAAGARVTGAGFGGCVVAVAARPNAEAVLAAVSRSFYTTRGVRAEPYLFAVEARAGAGILPTS